MTDDPGTHRALDAARRWREDLESWEIPAEILAGAPETPWGCPTRLFARSAEEAVAARETAPSPSLRRALEALPDGGSVLDVGAGGGAASLPLCPPGAAVPAVDQSSAMLAAFADLAGGQGIDHREVEGSWPDVAADISPADVVVCHHVLYNVGDLVPFVEALTRHARRRVVVEITAEHPQATLNPLWEHFHGVARPTRPTASDAAAVLRALGYDVGLEAYDAPPRWHADHREEMVAFTRRRLCLGAERDAEVAALLEPSPGPRPQVTLWWPGTAGR
ncbi:MAG TPA: class I SAM-dependent methyltransferase [Acidimicrobiales bacterium]|nr:class I SAM-dependent methyltransferase [Acidimicrobiales bacterium]